jgi:hypothetical protein
MSARENGWEWGGGERVFFDRGYRINYWWFGREAPAGPRTSWQARTPLRSHHSKILTISSSGRIVREAWLGRSIGLRHGMVEAIIDSGGRNATESPRASRDTMVMVAILLGWGFGLGCRMLRDKYCHTIDHQSPPGAKCRVVYPYSLALRRFPHPLGTVHWQDLVGLAYKWCDFRISFSGYGRS